MARFFFIFHALSFELKFLFDRRFPLMFPVVNVISFSPLDQQLLSVTEITYHLFRSVQFDFEEGNFRSGLIELLSSFAIAT